MLGFIAVVMVFDTHNRLGRMCLGPIIYLVGYRFFNLQVIVVDLTIANAI